MPDITTTRADWADDDEFDDPSALPPQQVIHNADGTKTVITYRLNEAGKKIKTTRKIRTTIVKEHVNLQVAERKEWLKFGQEKGRPRGPDLSTTSVGENIIFRPSTNWKATHKDDVAEEDKLKDQLKDKKVTCRLCKGGHFTARCPFKDTLPPLEDFAAGAADVADAAVPDAGAGEGSRYVAPHLRAKKGGGDSMAGGSGGSYKDRDDLATLRVTNVSEFAEEDELRQLFDRFGRVTRVFLAKDRDTKKAKGFAFVSYSDRSDAAKACEKMDGYGYHHLILRVEFAKRSQ